MIDSQREKETKTKDDDTVVVSQDTRSERQTAKKSRHSAGFARRSNIR